MLPSDSLPTPPRPGLDQHRDSVRASLQRANTAVAVAIIAALALAVAALWQSFRATRLQGLAQLQQQRAETAEQTAKSELGRALLAEARSLRLGQTLDRRAAALDSIRRAAAITPSARLRDEAVATLALPEQRVIASMPFDAGVRGHEFGPDMETCAFGYGSGEVSLRRVSDGAEIRRLKPADGPVPADQGAAVAFDFSPDGQLLAVRHVRGALAVWETGSGRLLFTRDADEPRHQTHGARFSSDGRHLVAPILQAEAFEVMEARTGKAVATFQVAWLPHAFATRPGATQFATYDGTNVVVLDWTSGETVFQFPYGGLVNRLNWSQDGRLLVIAGNLLEIHVRDLAEHRLTTLRGHKDAVIEAVFNPAGTRLATRSLDGSTRIWDLRDGSTLETTMDRRLIRWEADERTGWLFSGIRLEVRRQIPSAIHAVPAGIPDQADGNTMDTSPDGRWAVATVEEKGLLAWNLHEFTAPKFLQLPKAQSLIFNPQGSELLVIRDQGLETFKHATATNEGRVEFQLYDPEESVPIPRRQINLVTSSADGQTRVFVNVKGGAIWVQRPAEPDLIVELQDTLHSSAIYHSGSVQGAGSVALSPNGQWVVCGADGRRGTRVFDSRTGKPVKLLDDYMRGVQFSLDGRWLLLAGGPEARLFRTADWSQVWAKKLEGYVNRPFGAGAISPDGTQVAIVTSARRIALVEVASGRELALLESPSGAPPVTLRWPTPGDRLIALTRENSLNVWWPGPLRQELASLGLAGEFAEASGNPEPRPPTAALAFSTGWTAPLVLLAAGGFSTVALLSLRRHRRLIEDFAQTEALALRREQELQIEREVGQLKSSFVSMVSHEFRTPLGITMSAVELLRNYRDRLLPAKQNELLDDIHDSTRHMSDLMEQVLLLGRVEAGKLGCKPAPIDLPALAEKLADETVSATHLKCPVHVRADGELAGAMADESLVRHILGNLIANAVKYSPAGTPVELVLRRERDSAVFLVRDRGIGIPEADLPQLFQAFSRASNVGDIPGSGLGLVIVKRCVDLHGGTLSVKSRPGDGTEFTVRLPAFGKMPERSARDA